jgi:GTPase SAR1 family protein
MVEMIVIGTENSGKTVLVRSLKEWIKSKSLRAVSLEGISATIGTDITDCTLQRSDHLSSEVVVSIRELGSATAAKWHSYYGTACGIIYTIDASDIGTWSTSVMQVHECLKYFTYSISSVVVMNGPPLLKRTPMLIVLTKTDLVDTLSVQILLELLRLDEVKSKSNSANSSEVNGYPVIEVIQGSCFEESLIDQISRWIHNVVVSSALPP